MTSNCMNCFKELTKDQMDPDYHWEVYDYCSKKCHTEFWKKDENGESKGSKHFAFGEGPW